MLFKRFIFIILITAAVSLFWGCTFARQSVTILRSIDQFVTNKYDPSVLFEPGAEDYANKVVLFLPSAIQQVEEKQYRTFAKPVRLYMCASQESFSRMYGG